MKKIIGNIISMGEIKLNDPAKDKKFCESMRQLVTILFAVVFGVGLNQLSEVVWGSIKFWTLLLAYFAILSSWWGYHLGTIKGATETNIFNYIIDCSLLFIYWALINILTPLSKVLFLYFLMFFFYIIWEGVRMCRMTEALSRIHHKVKKAFMWNSIFAGIILIVFGFYHEQKINKIFCILGIFILLFLYR